LVVSLFELSPFPVAEDVDDCDCDWFCFWCEFPLFDMELLPEFLTVDVEDELPESFTLPPVAVAEPPAPPAPPVAVATLLFRFVLVLLPPVAVDEELPPVALDVELEVFLLLFEFELEF
jgi:hypothetical protein